MISKQRETSSAESVTLKILNWDGGNPILKSALHVGGWHLNCWFGESWSNLILDLTMDIIRIQVAAEFDN